MNRQDILREATRKAIKNGWKGSPIIDNVKHYQKLATSKIQVDTIYGESWYELVLLYLPPHDFAKALWGEEDTPYDTWSNRKYSAGSGGPDEDWYDGQLWEFHLQQMVVADDPIKYLGENI